MLLHVSQVQQLSSVPFLFLSPFSSLSLSLYCTGTHIHGLLQKSWIIGRASANQGQPLDALRHRGNRSDAGPELDAVLRLAIGLVLGKLWAARSRLAGAQEPGLDDMAELGRRTLVLEHLLAVVPSHAAAGGAAAHEDHFALAFRRSRWHDNDDEG